MADDSSRRPLLKAAIARRLRWRAEVFAPDDPRNRSPALSVLRAWQAARLERSFADVLADPAMAPAGRFFLSDLYGDRDYSARDRDVDRIMPVMVHLLPESLLVAARDAIELHALSHAFDLRLVEAMRRRRYQRLDVRRYAEIYRDAGFPRLRRRQIRLVVAVGQSLDAAVRRHGVYRLLRAPACRRRRPGSPNCSPSSSAAARPSTPGAGPGPSSPVSSAARAKSAGACSPATRSPSARASASPEARASASPSGLELLDEGTLDLALDRRPQGEQQEAEPHQHVHFLRRYRDLAFHPAAREGEGVAAPAIVEVEAAGDVFGDALHPRLGVLEREGMPAAEIDVGHPPILRQPAAGGQRAGACATFRPAGGPMRLTFPNGEHAAINIEQGQVGVGSAAGGGTSVIIPGLSPLHAVFAAGRRGQWLTVPQEAPVVVNARPVKRIAHLRPGDLVCLSGVQVRIESDQPPPEAAENGQGRRSGGDWASAAPRAVLRGMAGIWFGRSLPLQGPRVLGSGSGCDPRVEGEGVLERHALIDLEDGRLVIRAVAPGASLRVNGHAVRSAVLAAGDQIEIGTVR
jgi:hypothetical protein